LGPEPGGNADLGGLGKLGVEMKGDLLSKVDLNVLRTAGEHFKVMADLHDGLFTLEFRAVI